VAFQKEGPILITMKIVIAGSREFTDYNLLEEKCNEILFEELDLELEGITIISGTAKGADKLGENYAKEYGIKLLRFPALWDRHGKAAGLIRNAAMAKEADYVILFDLGTRGTADMLKQALKHNLPHKHFKLYE